MKIIYSGLESSGKSLKLAMVCEELVLRNSNWNKITGNSRPIISNMKFSDEFKAWAESKNVDIREWSNLDELIAFCEADIVCDEVGNYFDSRGWAELGLDVRRWLSQGAKTGIEFYGGAQDFAQVDKAFRRLVQPGDLYHITKIIGSRRPAATKPPVRRIWGLCMIRSLDPSGYDEDKKKFEGGGFPHFFAIRRRACEIFDTQQRIVKSQPMPYKHIERPCEDPLCRHERHIVKNGRHYLVTHA